jgi:benzodiazapine receptor
MAGAGSRLEWYARLNKPRWRPSAAVLGVAWTPLYVLTMIAGARALDRTDGDRRRALARTYAINLLLSGAWSPLFFGARSPRLALADALALDAANLDLVRRAWRADPLAAAYLLPYVVWAGYATAVTAAIVRRNPPPGPAGAGERAGPPARTGAGRGAGRGGRPGRRGSGAIAAW